MLGNFATSRIVSEDNQVELTGRYLKSVYGIEALRSLDGATYFADTPLMWWSRKDQRAFGWVPL